MKRIKDTLSQTTVFQQVRIFDGTHVLDENTVVVEHGTITAVGSHLVFPPEALVIEGTGLTLLPGLIDAHAHTFDFAGLRQALIFGVTTELDMGSHWRAVQQIKALQQTELGQELADL